MKRRGFTLWEVVAVLAVIVIAAAILYPVFARWEHKGGNRVSCQSNLKQIGLALKMYGEDYDEKYPLVVVSNAVGTKPPAQRSKPTPIIG